MQQSYDADLVQVQLDLAGATLIALHVPGCRPGQIRSSMPEHIREVVESYARGSIEMRPAPPTTREIAAMERTLGWIGLIPVEKRVYRRVVGLRMLVHPLSGRRLYGWRRIGELLRCSHVAVQHWHRDAISIIVGRLNAPGFCAAAGGAVGGSRRDVDKALQRATAKAGRRTGARVRELA